MLSHSGPPRLRMPQGEAWNIFGNDDRHGLATQTLPAAAIGLVRSGTNFCTGTLVGKRLVLTAAHCLTNLKTQQPEGDQTVTFVPNVIHGVSRADFHPKVVQVWTGGWDGNFSPANSDWAVLLLDSHPTQNQKLYPWIEVQPMTPTEGLRVDGMGYGMDFLNGGTLGVHRNCKIREVFTEGYFYHDCDNWSGASGGPIWRTSENKLYLVGINNSHFSGSRRGLRKPDYSRAYANVGVASQEFARWILDVRSEFP